MDALLPTLYFGRPIVAYNGRFDPTEAFELMARHGVTHAFLFPTALKAMMKAVPHPRPRYALQLRPDERRRGGGRRGVRLVPRGAGRGGQRDVRPDRDELRRRQLRHATTAAGSAGPPSRAAWAAATPATGGVIDDEGEEVPVGEPGEVACAAPTCTATRPGVLLGYWNNEAATRAKFTGDWCRTGDLAVRDADGYLWYQGRADDVFKAAGYRIGPGEIENCLVKHPAVPTAAVVPKPDAERGALVKAYVVLADFSCSRSAGGATAPDLNLIAALQEHVKGKLAPYEYPKEIEFIDQLPMTTTGKVQRRVLRLQEEERPRGRACVGVRSGRCGLRPEVRLRPVHGVRKAAKSRNRGARRRPCWWPDKVRNDECGLLPPCRVARKGSVCGVANPRRATSPAAVCALHPLPLRGNGHHEPVVNTF
jgi:acetyl-CoA synthetase